MLRRMRCSAGATARQPDCHVVIEDPFYPDMRELLKRRTANITTPLVDDDGVIIDEDVITVDITASTPAISVRQRQRSALTPAASARTGWPMMYRSSMMTMNSAELSGNTFTGAQLLDESGHVIYVGSFSKSPFRCGWVISWLRKN